MTIISRVLALVLLAVLPSESAGAQDVERIEVLPAPRATDLLTTAARRQLLDTLAAQHQRWNSRRPSTYVIRVLVVSDCIHVRTGAASLTHPRMTVTDTAITNRDEATIPKAYSNHCWYEWRVDDLFRTLANTLADTTMVAGDIQYDRAYGFPRYYWTARGFGRPSGVMVESFAPVP